MSGFGSELNSYVMLLYTRCHQVTSDIQTGIISFISLCMMLEIKHEMNYFSFVAIIMDETTDEATKSRLSTIIRYVRKSGNIVERFLEFKNVSGGHTALSQHIFNTLWEEITSTDV